MPDKEFKVRFQAKDDGFSAVSDKVKRSLDDIAKANVDALAHFTGGFLGGTAAQTILNILDRVVGAIRETAALVVTARDLGITTKEAVGTQTKSRFAGLSGNEAISAQGSAQQARAEALAGDPAYIEAFKAFRISLEDLAAMQAKDVFEKVADAFKREGYTPATKLAAARILGQYSETLAPYLVKGGASAFRGDRFESSILGQLAGAAFGPLFSTIDTLRSGRNQFRADLDPTSVRTVEETNATRRLAEQNRQREIDLARSQETPERRLNDLVRQRLEMQREMDFTTSPLERERLRSRLIDTTGQIYGLRSQIEAAGTPTDAPSAMQRNLSDLYRSGIFTGGSNLALQLQRETLTEIKRLVAVNAEAVRKL